MHKFIKKHHKTTILIGCIIKNILTAITIGDIFLNGLIGLLTGISIKAHLFDNHHLISIKKHHKYLDIPINPNKIKSYPCKCCNRTYYSIMGIILHKLNIL